MGNTISSIVDKIKKLEEELEHEFARMGADLKYSLEGKKVYFENHIVAYHRSLRQSLYSFIRQSYIPNILVSPVILSMIVPLALIDIWTTIYMHICFPAYGIEKIKRSDFIIMDRKELEYLNVIEKFNCVYCGYANGLASYVKEVAGATESYWCPIKHARRVTKPHSYYYEFVPYGDAEAYRKRIEELRDRQ